MRVALSAAGEIVNAHHDNEYEIEGGDVEDAIFDKDDADGNLKEV